MPLQATSGAASYDAFGGGAAAVPQYIEDVFSVQVYTGAGTSKTITNNIDLSTKGGLVWTKMRTSPASNAHDHRLSDSAIGVNQVLSSNNTNPKTSSASFGISAFNVDGYTITNPGGDGGWNYTNDTFVSWTFREQAKFFDVVTYTGNGSAGGQTINHNLASTPGCIIVKRTDTGEPWRVYHVTQGVSAYAALNLGAAFATDANNPWKTPTSTTFGVGDGTYWASLNASGGSYVAYLFAHNAGGFGLTGTDNVISCGSFTTNGSGSAGFINLGYEPQWFLMKRTDSSQSWFVVDNMRGMPVNDSAAGLSPNTSGAEGNVGGFALSATGINVFSFSPSATYIYIAIRRGPMKVPTSGTSVFSPLLTSTTSGATNTTGFPVDSQFLAARGGSVYNSIVSDRLRGVSSNSTETGRFLVTSATSAENTSELVTEGWNNTAFLTPSVFAGVSYITWNFGRAPSFFDEVCFTTTDGTYSGNHNLGVVPELLIFKSRDGTGNWQVVSSYLTSASYFLRLNSTIAEYNNTNTNYTATSTTLTIPNAGFISFSATMVAYLFATCAGVSKVGSYTGNGSSQTINCGFTGGARFVMVKATSTTGNWIVADSARGIVAGNDPALYLNSTAAEVTGLDWIDADNSGFVVNETATIAANTNGVSYIFFAVA